MQHHKSRKNGFHRFTTFMCGLAFIVGIMLAICAPSSGSAADLHYEQKYEEIDEAEIMVSFPFTWTGFYAGIHGGIANGNAHSRPDLSSFGIPEFSAIESLYSATHGLRGGIFGGHVGFNWQPSNVVLGVEISLSGSTNRGTGTQGDADSDNGTVSQSLSWIATATGRFGYAWDRTLIYGKGGMAWGHFDTSIRNGITITAPQPTHSAKGSTQNMGWVLGAGIEHAPMDNISVRLEYAHINFSKERFNIFDVIPIEVASQLHTVTVGVSYKF